MFSYTVCYPRAVLVIQMDEFPSEDIRYQIFIPEVPEDLDVRAEI
jgi:hypothetical protein